MNPVSSEPLSEEQVLKTVQEARGLSGTAVAALQLRDFVFESDVDFSGVTFTEDAAFDRAVFRGHANFRGCRFEGKVRFPWVTFEGEADFSGAIFEQHCTFGSARFVSKVRFDNQCTFRDTAYFGYTDFRDANFSSAKFYGKVYFDGHVQDRMFAHADIVQFKGVEFHNPRYVRFRGANLHRCSFLDTDISEVNFTDCEWPRRRESFGWRRLVYDELHRGPNESLGMVEKEYRLLRKNHEERGSYQLAGDFYYGEMEMRRLAQTGAARFFSLILLYKALSGYGEKYWLALAWLIILIMGFAAAYLFLGLALPSDSSESVTIKYHPSWSLWFVVNPQFWGNLADAILHSLEIATFQRAQLLETISRSGRAVEMGERVLVAIQTALTVLAIRRRFKR